MKIQYSLLLLLLLSGFTQCKSPTAKSGSISDEALMDTIQRCTFNYFWEGAEPNSGLACERIHMDGIYPEDDQHVVTTGGSGFVIFVVMYMAGIDQWVCIGFGVVSASVLVWVTFRMNSKYGEWGLMKLHALRSHPRYIISRRKFLRLFSPTIKNRKA